MRLALTALPLLAFAGLAALFYARLGAGDAGTLPSALIGQPAPRADLPPLPGLIRDGAAVPGLAGTALGGHGVTVVNVFASWCGPCREEHASLQALRDALTAGGQDHPKARLVGLNYKDDPDNARRFLGALGNPYAAVGVDAAGRAAIDWGVYGVPETFVIGADGTIRYKFVGPLAPESLTATLLPEIAKAAR